jgi:hypothetical protein
MKVGRGCYGLMTAAFVIMVMTTLQTGCAGHGEVVSVQLKPTTNPESDLNKSRAVSIGVVPFEDARPDTARLGLRRHLGGGESYFHVADGKIGEMVANAVAEFLRQRGWRAEVIAQPPSSPKVSTLTSESGVTKPASTLSGHDVTLGGKIMELSATADSRFMKTNISVTSKLLVQGLNASDGSTVRMTLNGGGEQTVFWFDAEDVQAMLNDVLAESLMKLDGDMKVEDKVLRLK